MNIKKIIFMGTPNFAVPSLRGLANSEFCPQIVITQPDRPKGRKRKLQPTPIKECALELGIKTILQPENVNDEATMTLLREFAPDIILTAAYGGYLKKEIRKLPRLGCLNLHPSLLPKYRGPAPINYTLFAGDKITGNTIFKISAKIDAGKIIYQRKTDISEHENFTDLQARLAEEGADDWLKCLRLLENGEAEYQKQNHSGAIFTDKIFKEDTFINWQEMNAKEIHNLVRGLAEKPGAVAGLKNKRIKIIQTKITAENSQTKAGTVLKVDKSGIEISTIDNNLIIERLQPAGKKNMSAYDFNLGAQLKKGDEFTNGF